MTRRAAILGGLATVAGGCAVAPPVENPALVRGADENPILVAPGAPTGTSYAEVYEQVLDVLDDYFELKPTSRYAGHIETVPRIAPGFEQPLKPGSPDPRERLLAGLQTIRHYAVVDIWAGERGGYRVYLEVHKELEDLDKPAQAIGGGAVFRESPTVERTFEVVGNEGSGSRVWIPLGRDYSFEQKLLRNLRDRRPCK